MTIRRSRRCRKPSSGSLRDSRDDPVPGPRVRYEHVKVIASNVEGCRLLQWLCTSYLLGNLPVGFQRFMSGARIVPLLKSNGKIRPLGLGHVLRRVATKALVDVFRTEVEEIVGGGDSGDWDKPRLRKGYAKSSQSTSRSIQITA